MSLLKQGTHVAGSRLLDNLMSLAIVLVMSRHFGEEGLGEFNYFFSLVSLFAPMMDLGAGMTLLQRWHDRDERGRRVLLTQLIVLKCAMGLLALSLAMGGDVLNQWSNARPLAVCAAFLAFFLDDFSELLRRPAQAQGHMALESTLPLVSRTAQLIGVLLFLNRMANAYQALYIYAAANALEALASIYGTKGCAPTVLSGLHKADWRELIRNGFPFALSSLFVMAMLHFDTVLLRHYSLKEAGAYSAATRIIMVLNVLNGGICHALFPKIMKAKADRDAGHAGWLINGTLRGFTILFGGIAIGGAVVGNGLMLALYGDKFTETGPIFRVLSPLILCAAYFSLLGQTLEILGQQRKVMYVYAVSAAVNILGNVLLIPHFGMHGAAAATILSQLYAVAMLFRLIFKNEHVKMYRDGIGRSVLFLSLLGALYVPLYWLNVWIAVPLGALIFAALLLPYRKYWLEGMGRLDNSKFKIQNSK